MSVLVRNRRNSIVLVLAVIVAIAVSVVVTMALRGNTQVAAEEDEAVASMFSFDGSKAPGWWQGATNKVSMAVFGSGDAKDCFISAEYKSGIVDVPAELKMAHSNSEQAGYTPKTVANHLLRVNVDGETHEYELHQIDALMQSGADPIKAGQGFGYVQLDQGYVKMLSLCDTPEQRALTYDALGVVSVVTDK